MATLRDWQKIFDGASFPDSASWQSSIAHDTYFVRAAALGAGLLWWSQWKKGTHSYTSAFVPSYIGACIATSYATYLLLIREGETAVRILPSSN